MSRDCRESPPSRVRDRFGFRQAARVQLFRCPTSRRRVFDISHPRQQAARKLTWRFEVPLFSSCGCAELSSTAAVVRWAAAMPRRSATRRNGFGVPRPTPPFERIKAGELGDTLPRLVVDVGNQGVVVDTPSASIDRGVCFPVMACQKFGDQARPHSPAPIVAGRLHFMTGSRAVGLQRGAVDGPAGKLVNSSSAEILVAYAIVMLRLAAAFHLSLT